MLFMMDDTVAITEAGYKTQIMNTHMNTHTAKKNCSIIHPLVRK